MADTLKTGLCIFGEVLFDHFPDGSRVLGGAPFNVAWHLQAMGHKPFFVSRVGADAEGDAVRAAMRRWGMQTAGLQEDSRRPTGRVQVSFENGEPSYQIVEDCAYDAIDRPGVTSCDLLYHGSLAARDSRSALSLREMRDVAAGRIFIDVNLRPPWWQREQLLELVQGSRWVKMNVAELSELSDPETSPGDRASAFLENHGLECLIITRGPEGAEMILADGSHVFAEPALGTEVVDTVGAGDAFAAVLIIGISRRWPHDVTLVRAQQFAGAIVARRGATVEDRRFYREFLTAWDLPDDGERV